MSEQVGAGHYPANRFSKLIESNSVKLFSMKTIGKTSRVR